MNANPLGTACLLCLGLLGCAAPTASSTQSRYYPHQIPVAGTLDIQIKRLGRHHLQIDNRTGSALPAAQLWLNRGYGGALKSIPVGISGPLLLSEFVNEHGEPYPTGTFLQPEKSRPVLLAELILDGQRHQLTVDLEKDWQKP